MTKHFNQEVALITGASRGIGRAIALRMADAGCRVVVNYSSSSAAAEEVVSECIKRGVEAQAIAFDVADSAATDAAIDSINKSFGRLDILVNNAGISRDGLCIRIKDQDWRKTLGTNLDGAFFCSRAVAKIMLKARSGRIINISSVVGEMGNAGQVPYVSSKAGLIGMTKALARELASRGITVNAITPGFIETDMTAALDEKTRLEHLSGIPLGRYGSADEVAQLVVFLASASAAYITGQIIGINGGLYM